MTFMDDVHHDSEVEAYRACDALLLWLQTIAPINNSVLVVQTLLDMAKDMNWSFNENEQGVVLLNKT